MGTSTAKGGGVIVLKLDKPLRKVTLYEVSVGRPVDPTLAAREDGYTTLSTLQLSMRLGPEETVKEIAGWMYRNGFTDHEEVAGTIRNVMGKLVEELERLTGRDT